MLSITFALTVGAIALALLLLAAAALAVAVRADARARRLEAETARLAGAFESLAASVRRPATPGSHTDGATSPAPPAAAAPATAVPCEATTAAAGRVPAAINAAGRAPDQLAASSQPPAGPPAVTIAARRTVLPPPIAPTPEPARTGEGPSLEERIGLTWITRLGAAAVVLGAGYFFKVAVERGWLGPWGRVLLGMVAGAALVAVAERVRTRADQRWVQALIGVGLALLYVASYAAYGFYHLVPLPGAFAGLAIVALFGGAMAYRHRAEVILVIALAAGFANPVLLSTGQDRPLALFAYLLLLTSASLAVSVALGFRRVPWLGLAGCAMLFIGWHSEFYHHAAPAVDALTGAELAATAGAYWPLAARTIPLAAVAAFTLQWLAFAFVRRQRGAVSRDAVLAPLLASLLVFHGGTAVLLADRPLALAVAMAIGGVIAVAALRRPEERPWLVVPLGVSFLVLAAGHQPGDALPATLVAAAWIGVYLVTLAGVARSAVSESTASTARVILGAATAGAMLLTAIWLLPRHPVGLALAAVVGAVAGGALAAATRTGALPAPAAAISVATLLVASAPRPPLAGGFLALVAATAVTYLASAAHSMLRRHDVSPGTVLLAAGAPIGLVAVTIGATATSAFGVRAVVSAAAGCAAFALGALVLRRVSSGRDAGTVLLATGLALVTLAVGLALSGVTITVAWSLMALVAVLAALRAGNRRFLGAGVLLFGVTLVRLLAVDLLEPARATARFVQTLGVEGAFRPTPLLNPRAIGLAAVAAALLVAARAASRTRVAIEGTRRLDAAFATLGYVLLIALAITEATGLATQFHAFPQGLAPDAFRAALAAAQKALAEQASRRAAVATLTLGIAGGALLVAGFAARSLFHRWAGLLVLAVTIGKLVLWDIWSLPTTFRVVVLLGVGAVLLTVGYLYARFGRRLVGMLTTAGLLAVFGVPLTAESAIEPGRFRTEAIVDHVPAGLVRFEVTPELCRAAHDPASFSDLRLVAGGRELPWTLRDVPSEIPSDQRPVSLFDPVVLRGGESRADFETDGSAHAALALVLEAAANFMREATIEVSDDRRGWARIGTATVYRITIGDATTSETTVRYPTSRSRWVRVTIGAVSGEQAIAIKGARFASGAPVTVPVRFVDLGQPRREPARAGYATVFTTTLNDVGVPLQAIVAAIATPRFERHVRAEGANADGVFAPAGSAVLVRAGSAENLRVPVSGAWASWRLVVRDGDDPPLDIRSLRGEVRRREVLFEQTAAGTVRLLLGDERATSPSYDLASTLHRLKASAVATVTVGALHPNPDHDAASQRPLPESWSERYRVVIGGVILLVLLGLGITAVRILRAAGNAGTI